MPQPVYFAMLAAIAAAAALLLRLLRPLERRADAERPGGESI